MKQGSKYNDQELNNLFQIIWIFHFKFKEQFNFLDK